MSVEFGFSKGIRYLVFILLSIVLAQNLMAEAREYTLAGQIMDSNDNLLPDKKFAEIWQIYGTTDPRH
ncbi:MAG: hypothetical protein PF904_19965 [Kiritimatiellae bacterium]|nr:hypothetical protein [Kiritimatiellia bacterium]